MSDTQKPGLSQEEVHILARNSNWSEEKIAAYLKEHNYSSPSDWLRFSKTFLLGSGVSFAVSGVVFFFAFNWEDLHKFFKIGIVEVLIVVSIALAIIYRANTILKNTIIAASVVMIGVLFAVFGQIYQTGANAYDFFLGWTIFASISVFISRFPPLWLIYLTLINTTIILYSEQVAHDWSDMFLITLLFIFNTLFLISAIGFEKIYSERKMPGWFIKTLALWIICLCTFGICDGIFSKYQASFFVLLTLSVLTYVLAYYHAIKSKSIFYLAIMAFSIVIIITSFFIEKSQSAETFLAISLFVVASITLVIKLLLNLQKKWSNE